MVRFSLAAACGLCVGGPGGELPDVPKDPPPVVHAAARGSVDVAAQEKLLHGWMTGRARIRPREAVPGFADSILAPTVGRAS